MKDYAKIASSLYALVSGYNASKEDKPVQWTKSPKKVFKEVHRLCTSAPILAFTNVTKPFKQCTNASGIGLGAVLYQDQDGVDRIIRYGSRGLNKGEANLTTNKLEFLALKWVITTCFHKYLYGNNFIMHSDNNPLAYMLTTAKLDATSHRLVAQLATYNVKV